MESASSRAAQHTDVQTNTQTKYDSESVQRNDPTYENHTYKHTVGHTSEVRNSGNKLKSGIIGTLRRKFRK